MLLKTDTTDGYNARVFTARISTGMEKIVISEGFLGGLGGVDITVNGNQVVYTRDVLGF